LAESNYDRADQAQQQHRQVCFDLFHLTSQMF
jgi:hypothetical protein